MWWSLILRYWKIWVPVLVIVLVGGTIYAQQKRINSLKEDRNVAITERDRMLAENQSLLQDRVRLSKILVDREKQTARLQSNYDNAVGRLKALQENRPDIRDWSDTVLPVGMWAEVHGRQSSTAGASTHSNTKAAVGAED